MRHVDEALDVLRLGVSGKSGQEQDDRPLVVLVRDEVVLLGFGLGIVQPIEARLAAVRELEDLSPVGDVRDEVSDNASEHGLEAGLEAPDGGSVLLAKDAVQAATEKTIVLGALFRVELDGGDHHLLVVHHQT